MEACRGGRLGLRVLKRGFDFEGIRMPTSPSSPRQFTLTCQHPELVAMKEEPMPTAMMRSPRSSLAKRRRAWWRPPKCSNAASSSCKQPRFSGAVIGESHACWNKALIACNQRTCSSQIRVEFLKAKNS